MLVINDKLSTTCLNWQFINKDNFPEQFNNVNVKEDFELLFQQNYDPVKLKELLRRSTRDPNQSARKFLWKRILLQDRGETQMTIEKYNKKIAVLFGKNLQLNAALPNFVSKEHPSLFYYLNDDGRAAVCRVLNVLASAHPDITYAPLLLPLGSLFLHYMSEAECYACLLSVVESNNKITQTDIHWATTNLVFRRFAQKYTRVSYQFLLDGLENATGDLESSLEAVDDWQWWIFEYLPFNYVLNIVDCFLLEGQKVLYRYGICLLEYFFKSHHQQTVVEKRRVSSTIDLNAVNDFCRQIGVSQETLVKAAFGLRNMRRKDIDLIFQAEEKAIKKMRSKTTIAAADTSSHTASLIKNKEKKQQQQQLPKPKSKEINNNNNKCTNEIVDPNHVVPSTWQMALKTFGISKKWHRSTKQSRQHLSYHLHHPESSINLPTFSLENTGSEILSPQQVATIWHWLPKRYQILELQVIYSSNIHGCRLMTLFDKIEYYQATILIIQTTTGAIFGAYCSEPWSNRLQQSGYNSRYRRPSFFGNGETFLFELKPNVAKHDWVGKIHNGNTCIEQEMFLYADNNKLVIGGGGGGNVSAPQRDSGIVQEIETTTTKEEQRGMGLLVNADLINGRSARCDTFDNKALGEENEFEIAVLEVLSFNGGVNQF